MPPEDAVLDATTEAVEETPIDTGETTQEADTGAAEPSGEPETGGTPAVPEPPVIDGKRLSSEAKATIEEIHAKNPILARELRNALFAADRFRREVPGGLREVQELRQTIEDMGGPEGIGGLNQEISGWREFDSQFTAGDPKALDFILSSDEGKQAFASIAPTAFDRYAELDQPGYESYIARQAFGSLNASGIPLAIQRLVDLVGDNPKAVEQLQTINNWVNYMQQAAMRKNESPKIAQPKVDGQLTEAQQKLRTYEREEWKRETAYEQSKVFNAEWNRIVAGRKLSDTQTAAIRELFQSRLDKVVRQHVDKLNRFFDAKDKEGFLRYASGITRNEIPKALRAAFDAILPNKPGPKAPVNGAQKVSRGTAPVKPPVGFQVIQKEPSNDQIDMRHPFNNPANYSAGKAVLKDGKRVQWKT